MTTTTPPGATVPRPRPEPREVFPGRAEIATRADWQRITGHLGTLPGPAAANAWGVLGQFLAAFEAQTASRQRVPAGQSTSRIEEAA